MDGRQRITLWLFVLLMLAATVALFAQPPFKQDPNYHDFADQRSRFGIPNFDDVASNLPFLIVGVWALNALKRRDSRIAFTDHRERRAYLVTFAGLTLTFFGSSYYHWHPDNQHLVWDRMPYTLLFMGLLSATLAERVSLKAGLYSLLPFILAGPASVIYWTWTESHNAGDLRPYFLVQFGSVAAIILMLVMFRSSYTHTRWVVAAVITFAIAKVVEALDRRIYSFGNIVSGHTLKHLFAAAAMLLCLEMILRRKAIGTRAGADDRSS